MKLNKNIIVSLILAVLLVFLLNPQWIPFLSDASAAAIQAQIKQTFGGLLGGSGTLTPANLAAAAAAAIVVWLLCNIICFALKIAANYRKKARSMAGLFTSLTKFICVIAGGVWVLGILGVNLAGIFASLGIVSLIIGFGAQSLIEDAVTGVFIIFEGQYHVGDIIVLDEFRGTVRNIGIRTTAIEDDGGNVKIVNNSDIRNLQNRSMNRSVCVCDLSISYDAYIPDVEKVIFEAIPQIYEKHRDIYLTPPRYVGVQALGESSVVLRVVADVTEQNFFVGFRTLNREFKILFDEKGIESPYNQLVIHQAK